MNTIFRTTQRASRRPAKDLPQLRQQRLALSLALALGSMAFCGGALAAAAGGVAATTMPVGGVIVGGVGSITQSGASTVVNQQSALLALNWQSFNLGKDASVLFNQPSHSAIALNRIFDQNPSQIFGHINSNGQVFLINTHGIIFGSSAQLNVGGLVASTLDLTPDDFLSNHFNLDAHGGSAGIVNHGTIEAASGGSVNLIGGKVENDGLIVANLGSINLDGADKAVLDFDGDGLVGVQITGALQRRLSADEAAVANKGTLQAEGGTVVLQASAAEDLFTNLVNNSGVIDAHGISTDGGVVRLIGAGGNTVDSGSIDASGVHGGSVQVLSDQEVNVSGSVDASGALGGGSIRVGGGWHGGEGLTTAQVTYVGANAVLDADATQSGQGGSVVVWSDRATGFFGNISARGGAGEGDGGQAEVSSHGYLQFDGNADLRADTGHWGTLLLDPGDVTISTSADSGNAFGAGGVFNEGAADPNSNIKVSTLLNQLNSSNVDITAAGNIDVQKAITYTGSVNRTLTLDAGGTLSFDNGAVVSATGTGSLSGVLTGTGGVTFATGSGFAANGGSLSIDSGTSITVDGALSGLSGIAFSGVGPTGAGSISGSGAITGLSTTTFALTGPTAGTAGGIGFSGFTSADATTVTGAPSFDVSTKVANGITFADVTNVAGSSASATLTGSGQTYTLDNSTADKGSSGSVSWTSFGNIDDTTGTVSFGTGGSVTGNVTAATLNYSSYSSAVSFGLGGTSTGIGGTWSGVTSVTGSSASNTITGANQTYTLTGANAGGNGTVNWTSFGSIADSGTGTLKGAGQTYTLSGSNAGTVSTWLTGSFSGIGNVVDTTGTVDLGTGGILTGNVAASVVNFGTNGTVGGNVTAPTLDYSGYGSAVSFGLGGTTTGVGGTWSGVTSVTGSGHSDTLTGSGQTYTLTGANAGGNGTVNWTSFENIADTTGTVAFGSGSSLSGSVTAKALDYSGYGSAVSFGLGGTTTGVGGTWSGVTSVTGSSASNTITGANQTYTLTGANAGGNGTVNWTSFGSIADSGTGTLKGSGQTYTLSGSNAGTVSTWLTGSFSGIGNVVDTTGTVDLGTGGILTGNVTASVVNFGTNGTVGGNVTAPTLDYSGYGSAVSFGLGGTTTGVGGTWSGVTSVTGSGHSDTLTGSGQTYTLTGANAGGNGTVNWTSFENIADTTGTVAFGSGSSLSGSVTAKALDYSGYGSAVSFGLGGTTTGVGGTWSGVTSVTGSSASNTITGANQTYTLTGANAGGNGTVNWTSFGSIADSGTGTLKGAGQTYTLSGSNAGTVSTWLTGSFSGIGNVVDTTGTVDLGTGGILTGNVTASVVNFGTNGTVGGNVTAPTLDYSSYGSAVSFGLGGTTTGVGGTWSGVTSVTGSSASNTITGANQTYTLTGANAGGNGTVSWTSFGSIADSGTGTLKGAGQTYTLSGSNAGTVSTWLTGSFSGIGNVVDTTGTVDLGTGGILTGNVTASVVNFGTNGTVGGNVTAPTLDYSGYGSAVSFGLGGTTTGVGGTWSGVTSVTGSGHSDTLTGSGQTYTLTGANAGGNGTVNWTSFENIADTTGTVAFGSGSSLSGSVTAKALDYSGYGSAVSFSLGGTTTGVGGTWSGVTSVTGSSASNTITGANQTYTLTGANAGGNGTVSWTSFGSIADSGTGTLKGSGQTYTLSGSNAGTVSTWLTGSFSGIGNVVDTTGTVDLGTGGILTGNVTASVVNFGTNGTVGGNVTAPTLDYSGYGSAVSFGLGGTTTGVGGTWSGVTSVTGSSASNTITGANQTYTLTGANAGGNGTVNWTSFGSIADSGTGTLKGSGQTYTLSGSNAGTVSTWLTGSFSGIGNVVDTTGTVDLGTGGILTGNVTASVVNFGTNGTVGGNVTAPTLDYSSYGSAVSFGLGGTTTGVGGTWSGVTSVTGSSASNTITGANQTYTLTGANAGGNGTVSWTSFGSIADSGTGTLKGAGQTYTLSGSNAGTVSTWLTGSFSGIGNVVDTTGTVDLGTGGILTGNVTASVVNFGTNGTVGGNVTAPMLDYSGYGSAVSFGLGGTTTGVGGTWSGVTSVTGSGHSDTLTGSGQTYTLTGANAGGNGTVNWTSFENVSDATGTVNFGAGGSLSGNVTAQSLDYSGYGSAVNFDLSDGSGTSTGIGGTWSGVTSVTGSGHSDTLTGSGQTYTLTGANAGGNGTVNWTSFENVSDATGAVNFGTGGSLSGNVTAQSLDYSGYGSAVTFDLSDGSGTSTGIGGTWSGVTSVTGSGHSDTLTGSGQTYTLTGANAGGNGTVSWTSFENVSDATGAVSFGTGGSLSGNVTAQSLDYSGYGSAVTFDLSDGSGTSTGIGGTWSGVTSVTGSGHSDTLTGSGQTYTLTGANAGGNGTVSWTSFENVSDATGAVSFGTGGSLSGNVTAQSLDYSGYGSAVNFDLSDGSGTSTGIGGTWSGVTSVTGSGHSDTLTGSGQTYTLTGANAGGNGTVNWTSFENIADTTGTVAFGSGSSLSGSVTAKALDYSGYGSAVNFDLSDGSGTSTGIGGTWSGVTSVTGSGHSDTLTGSGQTYTLTGANAGGNGTVNWTSFENVSDATGTVNFGAGGSLSGNVTAQSLDYSGYGSAVNFDLSDGSGTSTGIGGTWSGVTSVTGSGHSDTLTGSGQTYTLTGANAGGNGTVNWTSFENVSDATGTVNFGAGGSLTGNVTAHALDYSGYGSAVTFDLSDGSGTSTGIGGTWSGVTSVTGSGHSDTLTGSGQTYTLTGANAGGNGTVNWTSFENVSDATGTVNFGTGGSLSGNVTAQSLDYSGYGSAVTFDLSDGSGTSTGIGGTWSGVTSVTGSGHSDTLTGSGQTYTLTGANAGGNGTVNWTSFENIADSGVGTIQAANQTWALTGHNQGTVTDLSGSFSGIGNLTDTGSGTFLMHQGADGDLSGNLVAGTDGTLNYTGYTTPVNVNLSGAGTTGVGGSSSGVGAIIADSNLSVSGTSGTSLDIATSGTGVTTTLGSLAVGSNLTINASGAVSQNGSGITVGGATVIDVGSGAIALTNSANDFVGAVTVSGQGIALADKNDLTVASLTDSANGAVSLIADGTLSLSATTVDAGSGDVTLASNGGALATAGAISGGDVSLAGYSDLTLGGPVAAAGTLSLTSSHGAISQSAGTIVAGVLTGSSMGSTALNGANAVGTLGSFTANGFSLTNAQALAVTGTVDGGANGTRLTTSTGNLTINGTVGNTGGVTTLKSAGSIGEGTTGVVNASTLTGSSAGSTALNGANAVGTLGSFTANGFSLTNTKALTVTGSVDGGTGGTSLTTSAGDLTIDGAVGNTGGTTTLASAGAIAEGANGVVDAATLIGNAVGSVALGNANGIANLGNFTANGFSLTDAQALTVSGTVDGGAGGTTLTTSSGGLTVNGSVGGTGVGLDSAGDLAINGGLNSGSGAATLASGGAISEGSGGVITAATLTGSSTGSTALNGANRVGTLGNFTANGFSLTNAQVLTVAGTIDGGSGATSIATTAGALTVYGNVSGGSVALGGQAGLGINGDVDSGSGTTTLTSGSTISEGSGSVITAGTLTGSSSGATVLGGANVVAKLGNFTANGFSFTNARALTVSGAVNGGNGTTSLATTAGALTVAGSVAGSAVNLSGAGIAIDGSVNSGSGTTTLSSTGDIGESGSGVVTAGTLVGNASGSATLNGANQIGNLGGFSANGIGLTNAQALTVAGAVNSGSGATSLVTTAGALTVNGNVAGSAVTLNGNSGLVIDAGVNSGSGMTTLLSGGSISEGSNGVVTAGLLTGQSTGSTSLDQPNMVATLGSFTANGFTLLNGEALTVAGPVNGGSGITLQTTSGGLTIDGALSAKLVSLQSAGAIDGGAGGSITAATLTGSAVGPTVLGSATQFMGNHVGTLGGFASTAGFSFTDAQTLTLASVNGSAYTVNAGTSALYLGVQGDLLQQGTTWAYDGGGTWSATGRLGTAAAPIYVTGVSEQVAALVGSPPGYFYAVDAQGNLLPVVGAPSVNVPTSALTGRAQNGNHGDAYIDPSVVTANYRSFGIVPSGILLPPDQQDCQPGQPASASCPDDE